MGPDLGQNCLQMLSADDMSDILMQKVKYNGFDPGLSEPKHGGNTNFAIFAGDRDGTA